MAHGSATEGQDAVRPSRWVSRALFVLGGAAAAWMISDASASAAEEPKAPSGASAGLTPLTDATVAGLDDATRGVSGFTGDVAGAATTGYRDAVCHQDVTAWSVPETAAAKKSPSWCTDAERHHSGRVEHEVSGRVSDAVTDLASDAVVHPVSRTLGAFEHIVRKPEDAQQVLGETLQPADGDLGQRVWNLLNNNDATDVVIPSIAGLLPERGDLPTAVTPPVAVEGPTALQLVTVVLPDSAKSAFAAALGAASDESSDVKSESRDDQSGSKLPFPMDRLPIAPSAPTAPGGGSAPGGHCDGPAFGFISGASASLINASVSNALAGVRHMPLTPGSQPGVTPD